MSDLNLNGYITGIDYAQGINRGSIDNARITSSLIRVINEGRHTTKELTKEEKLEKVNQYIKDNNVEVDKEDENYIYLYKPTDLEGKDKGNDIIYAIGKTIVKDNIVVYTEEEALKIYKDNSKQYANGLVLSFGQTEKPINPSILTEETFRLFRVKVNKNNIKFNDLFSNVILNLLVNEIEVIEEVDLGKSVLEYTPLAITEQAFNKFNLSFEVRNKITGKNIKVDFDSDTIDLTQEEIKTKIKERIDIMQKIYDKFAESNGEL
jgi:hypothetical protein